MGLFSCSPSLKQKRTLVLSCLYGHRDKTFQVNVPFNNVFSIVTVRCGHCANMLSVSMEPLLQTLPFEYLQNPNPILSENRGPDCNSSLQYITVPIMKPTESGKAQILPIRPPEKRQRVPSAYNRFIKEEIQRIKANNPSITHREAFSAAAKNWAHFPRIHFGDQQMKLDDVVAAEGTSTQSKRFNS